MTEEEFVDPTEMANILKVPKTWIYNLTRPGGIGIQNGFPVIRVGKYVRMRPSEVIEWIEKHPVLIRANVKIREKMTDEA